MNMIVLLLAAAASAATPDGVRALANDHYEQNYREILAEYDTLVSIPNHAANRADIERNLAALEAMLARRGLVTRRLPTQGASPALYGELPRDTRRPTLLFYAHYDGQPAGEAGWKTPAFQPTLSRDGKLQSLRSALGSLDGPPKDDWRIYARSAADDKAPIVALVSALDALAARDVPLAVNLKVFLEGEEEVGSPHLAHIVREHAELVRADLLLFADGPRHQSGRPQVVLGVRGVQSLELTLFGAARALHSGHYGGWTVNPAARLAELLTSMRAPDGRVRIEGYYDEVDRALAALGSAPDEALERSLLQELRITSRESTRQSLAESVASPALNIVGVSAGDTGAAARNAIPADATANLDLRLVPNQTPQSVRKLVEKHLQSSGYRIVHERDVAERARDRDRIVLVRWDAAGYPGVRFTQDEPAVHALIELMRTLHGEQLAVTPILGGSLPLALFVQNAPVSAVVVLPIANHDNNQHAPNENLTLGSLRYGITTFAAILAGFSLQPSAFGLQP
jgi:acetylornithine deacetylase/succinyl-diaminopimelate desuccinylase-like protein